MQRRIRVNRQIRARELRLIDEDGKQLGIIPLEEALAKAEERGLDLVEVAPSASPPVCRIMNYGKYRYAQSKKQQLMRKSQKQIQVKEVKFRPKIDEHDYQFKKKHILRFLNDGNLVKATLRFRGREIAHIDYGSRVLNRLMEELKDIATIEKEPKLEGKNLVTVFSAKKPKKVTKKNIQENSTEDPGRKE